MATKRSGAFDVDFQGPFRGLATKPNPNLLGPAWFRDCQNVIVQGGAVEPYPPIKTSQAFLWGDATYPVSSFTYRFQPDASGDVAPDWILLVRSGFNDLYLWQPGMLGGPDLVGAAPDADCSFMRLGDWVVVCGRGATVMVKVNPDGTFVYRPAGLTPPVNAPAHTDHIIGGGLLVGAFSWRYTFYDSVNGYESAPSPVSTPASGNGMVSWFTFDAIPAAATHIRLYQKREGSQMATDSTGAFRGDGLGASDDWYFVEEFPVSHLGRSQTSAAATTTTVTLDAGASSTPNAYVNMRILMFDGPAAGQVRKVIAYNHTTKVVTVSVPFSVSPTSGGGDIFYIAHANQMDSELTERRAPSQNQRVDTTSTGTTREMLFCAYGVDRAFYSAGDNVVWFSELPRAGVDRDAFPSGIYVGDSSFFIVDVSEGEYVTGLRWFDQYLLVLTNLGAFAADTSDLESGFARTRRLVRAAGCVSHRTIQECPATSGFKGHLMWASPTGIERFDGVGTECLSSDALYEKWPSFVDQLVEWIPSSGIDQQRGLYIVTVFSTTFVCEVSSSSWTRILISGDQITTIFNARFDDPDPTPILHFGVRLLAGIKKVERLPDRFDDADNIFWMFETVRLQADSSAAMKAVNDAVISFDRTKSGEVDVLAQTPLDSDGDFSINCKVTPITNDPNRKPLCTHVRASVGATVDRIGLRVSGTCINAADFARVTGLAVDAVPSGVR